MAAPVFLYHVVGDLTLGKPELVEFHDTEPLESAARAIAGCSEAAIPVWRRRADDGQNRALQESPRPARFVGMLTALDLVAFVARAPEKDKAMRAPVSEVVVPNNSLLKEVDPQTRLIDALEMMKQGVRRLLVRKSSAWKGMSKRFSVLYNGKWLKAPEASSSATSIKNMPSSSSSYDNNKYCCLTREDVIRFIIGCLGALAPIPLNSISALGAVTPYYYHIESCSPAIEAAQKPFVDPCAIAVVEINSDGTHRIIGEISAYKLWKCDHFYAAWAMANLSAGQFVMGAEDNKVLPSLVPDISTKRIEDSANLMSPRPRKFSSRNIGFFNKPADMMRGGGSRSMHGGRSVLLTCKTTSSLAAVMAQMLSHRATHVWVTDKGSDDILVGVVGYVDIIHAVTRNPNIAVSTTP